MKIMKDWVLHAAARHFHFNEESLVLINDGPFSPNAVYGFSRADGAYILRITRKKHRHIAKTLAEIDWINFLYAHGACVSPAIRAVEGSFVVPCAEEEREYILSAFERAHGQRCDKDNPATWNPRVFHNWGRAMGDIHRITRAYSAPPGMRRATFDGGDALNPGALALPALREMAIALIAQLDALPRDRANYTLIHADLHQNNFLVEPGEEGEPLLHVFDFDDSMYGPLALDIGIALYHAVLWGVQGLPNAQQQAQKVITLFMRGYLAANTLSDAQLDAIVPCMRFRKVCEVGWSKQLALESDAWIHRQIAQLQEGILFCDIDIKPSWFTGC